MVHPDIKELGRIVRIGHRITGNRRDRARGAGWEFVLTDNGMGYRSKLCAAAIRRGRLIARRTRPYTPRTNGKAERFIQTLLREWPMPCPTRAPPTALVRSPAFSIATTGIGATTALAVCRLSAESSLGMIS
jgi:transposase InsO family protein